MDTTFSGRRRHRSAAALALGIIALTGCAAQSTPISQGPASAAPSPAAATAGLVDVGGHGLYLSCTGEGSPTVVFVHGWVHDDFVPHTSLEPVARLLEDDFRVCVYDRRNVGASETVDEVQTPDDMRHDMEQVLEGGGVEPPYVLLAASFGGLVAYDFLSHHPEDVVGVVFDDAMIPDELALDEYLAAGDTFRHYHEDDMCCSRERISQYELISSLQPFVGHEPDIPAIYLGAAQEPRVEYDWVTPEYANRYPDLLQGFVDRFSPGELRWVEAPHYMEPVVPDEIAQAVRDVAASASAE